MTENALWNRIRPFVTDKTEEEMSALLAAASYEDKILVLKEQRFYLKTDDDPALFYILNAYTELSFTWTGDDFQDPNQYLCINHADLIEAVDVSDATADNIDFLVRRAIDNCWMEFSGP